MSQDTIMELMKKQPKKWFNIEEVFIELKISRQSTTHSFSKLRLGGFVDYDVQPVHGKKAIYIHRYK